MIMLFNQPLDMPHLSGGWIGKREMLTNKECKYVEFENIFVQVQHFWDLLFQLMKHGTNTTCCVYIFVQCTKTRKLFENLIKKGSDW